VAALRPPAASSRDPSRASRSHEGSTLRLKCCSRKSHNQVATQPGLQPIKPPAASSRDPSRASRSRERSTLRLAELFAESTTRLQRNLVAALRPPAASSRDPSRASRSRERSTL